MKRLVENISSKLAFFPPTPATYEVATHPDGSGELFIRPLFEDIPQVLNCTVKKLRTRPTSKGLGGGSEIVAAFVPHRSHSKSSTSGQPLTILYSHGNAVDLGQMLPMYREISKILKVNVMGYDYTGYGACSGQPTVSQTLSDIQTVYDCLQKDFNIPPSHIVLYGQSVGSGPSAWLGAQEPNVAGVILHSPLMSGMRVLKPNLKWWPAWADVYPNHLLAPKIEAPTLIMHGTEDEVIHISCSERLAALLKNKYPPLWAQGYNHQNLETSPDYLPTLEAFLKKVHPTRKSPRAVAASDGVAASSGRAR